MDNDKATETVAQTIAPAEDLETKVTTLEAEKAQLLTEKDNYRKAYLKAVENGGNEQEEDKIRRVTREEIANSRLSEINREQQEVIAKALKENKELKLAQLSKNNTPPAAIGAHSEGVPVTDTLVTPEQMAAFKAKGWTDKDIERYKKNLQRYGK